MLTCHDIALKRKSDDPLDREDARRAMAYRFGFEGYAEPQKAIPAPLEADFRAFEATPRPRTKNPYPPVFGPIRTWPSGTRTQDLLPNACARCLHSLNFQPFPLLHTLT